MQRLVDPVRDELFHTVDAEWTLRVDSAREILDGGIQLIVTHDADYKINPTNASIVKDEPDNGEKRAVNRFCRPDEGSRA